MLKMQTQNYCQRLLENIPLEMEENSTVSFDVEGNLKFFQIKIYNIVSQFNSMTQNANRLHVVT